MKKLTAAQLAGKIRSQDLQIALLSELEAGPSTTVQLAASLGQSRKAIFAALDKLHDASMVESAADRRRGPDGCVIGTTWVLFGQELPARAEIEMAPIRKLLKPMIIPRDPWIWALHGAQP